MFFQKMVELTAEKGFIGLLHQLIKQSVICAVPDKLSVGPSRYSHLKVPLGILLLQRQAVTCQKRDERNIMFLDHRMVRRNVVIVFDNFYGKLFLLRCLHRLESLELLSAAGNSRISHCCYHIAAFRAYIEIQFFHIASSFLIGIQLAGQKLFQIHTENPGQVRQKRNIRTAQPRFP